MLRLIRTSRVSLPSTLKVHTRTYRPTYPRSYPRDDHHHSGSSIKKTLGYVALGGVAAGSVILVGVYSFYHTSGIKKVVDTVRPAIAFLKDSRSELGKSHPVEALRYLRQAVKLYVSYYPGAGYLVDIAFDGLDGIVEAHRAEVGDIIMRGQNSIREVIERDGNDRKPGSALEVLSIIRHMLVEIKDVAQRTGAPIAELLELDRRVNELGAGVVALFTGVISKTPEIKEKFGEYAEYAKAKSPEVSAKIGEYAQSAKDYAAPKASSLYDSAKAQAPGIKGALSSAAEKASVYSLDNGQPACSPIAPFVQAKNAVFPPKDC